MIKKRITAIGIGLGADTVTPEASKAIAQAEILLGPPRLLELFKDTGKPSYPCYLTEDIRKLINKSGAVDFALLVSGDVGFFSAAAGLAGIFAEDELRFIPGVSAVNALFARLMLPWQDAAFVSAHGREANIADTVRRNHLTFCLTGNNISKIGASLCKAGFGQVKTYIGENLGTKYERVFEIAAEELTEREFPPLTALILQNEHPDAGTPAGLPDSCFSRTDKIPMTKSETRAVALSRLNIKPDYICWDVGAGTGSVTVEMALSAWRGHVHAIERREDAISRIEENIAAFHIGNATAICGEAPEALAALPPPDAVFIGGSGGELKGIIARALDKNPGARIVVTAVTVETVSEAMAAFADSGLEPEIIQLNTARGIKTGRLHIMKAQNPVTILSAGGAE